MNWMSPYSTTSGAFGYSDRSESGMPCPSAISIISIARRSKSCRATKREAIRPSAVEPTSGLGVVILQNGSGSKEDVVNYALDAARACITDAPLPEVWSPPEPTSIPEVENFVGEYLDPEGRDVLNVRADVDGLRIAIGETSGRLERDPLRFEAGSSIRRAEGPVRSLLVAKVDCDRHVIEDSGFALGTPEQTTIDSVD